MKKLYALSIMLMLISALAFAQTTPALIVGPPYICPGDEVAFIDSTYSESNGYTYNITFGDGQQSLNIKQSVEQIFPALALHTYPNSGSYNYTFSAVSPKGQTTTINGTITVSPFTPAFADMFFAINSAQQTQACPDETVGFFVAGGKQYVWHFGDGMTSTSKKAFHMYPDTGTYNAYVIATNGCGRSQTLPSPVTVTRDNPPFTDFMYNTDAPQACASSVFSFTPMNLDTLENNTYYWKFDGVPGPTTRETTHVFGSSGMHTATLIMSNNCGTDSATKTIMINDAMSNLFINNQWIDMSDTLPYEMCPGSSVSFEAWTNFSKHDTYTKYAFGDGTSIIANKPSHTYNTIGEYTVTITFFNLSCGDSLVITKDISVNNTVKPDFNMWTNNWNVCPNEPVLFSTDIEDATSSFIWSFGDGYNSTMANPTHSYAYPGNFSISLIVTNSCGLSDTNSMGMTINDNAPVNAWINAWPMNACPGEVINFNASGGVTYAWDMGDGSSYSGSMVEHSYPDTGSYTIRLIAENGCGNVDTAMTNVWIQYNPFIGIEATIYIDGFRQEEQPDSITICPGTTVHFYQDARNADATMWDFGDGTTTPLVNNWPNDISHTFNAQGVFAVKYIATSPCWSDTAIKYVTVTSGAMPSASLMTLPSMAFSQTDSMCPGEKAFFFDNQYSNYGNMSYSIWFGDGDSLVDITVPQSSIEGVLAEHIYETEGVYDILFTSTNACNNTYQHTSQIIVSTDADRENVFYYVDNNSQRGENGSTCPNTPIEFMIVGGSTYEWHFGDASPVDTNAFATHSYATTGTFDAFCIATNGCGRIDTLYTTVKISNINLPNTSLDIEGGWGKCFGDTVRVRYWGDNDDQYTYLWNFGDGTTSTEKNPWHVYATSGNFVINGSITNGCGTTQVNSFIQISDITVNLGNNQTICEGQSSFLALNQWDYDTFNWSTGSTSNSISIIDAGTYSVTVTDWNGCSASDNVEITVNPSPTASVTENQSICQNESVTLTASGGAQYIWSNNETSASITVSPWQTTTYYVNVGTNNCFDNAQVVVTVNQNPMINLGPMQTICSGETITLDAPPFESYQWNTGATTQSITETPFNSNWYSVEVTDINGCKTTGNVFVQVNFGMLIWAGNDKEVCLGDSVMINSSFADSYEWSNGATTQAVWVKPTSTTIYTVTATEFTSGCTSSDDIIVSVFNVASISAGTDKVICKGENAQLVASGGSSYEWSNGYWGSTANVSPTTTTTYTVTGYNMQGCSATDVVVVTVNAVPTANVGNDMVICPGVSTTLTATGGGTYEWNTGQLSSMIVINPTSATFYTVTVTNAAGCTSTDVINVGIKPTGPLFINGNGTICQGASTELTASGGLTFNWNTGATTNKITVSPANTSTYSLTITDGQGCNITAQRIVTVNPNPVANAGIDKAVCLGQSAMLTAGGGATYVWNTSENNAIISVTPVANTTYAVTATNSFGCSSSDEIVVSVNALPTASISGTFVVCPSANATLTASGGSSYVWSTGATTASITTNPLLGTNYTVTVMDANSCISSASQMIGVSMPPMVHAGIDAEITTGSSASLNGSVMGGTGPFTIAWTDAQYVTDPAAMVTTTKTLTSTQVLTMNVTDAYGCVTSDMVVITVTGGALSASINTSNASNNCANTETILTAMPSGGSSPYTYAWSTSKSSQVITETATTATTYTVTITDNNSNTVSVSVTITPETLPTVDAGANTAICQGSSVSLTASGASTYNWSNAETGSIISVSPMINATYVVVGTGANLCTASDYVVVAVGDLPTITISDDISICSENSTSLTADGGVGYVWSTLETSAIINVNPMATTTYLVTVTNITGCTAIADVVVTIKPLPVVGASADKTICKGQTTTLNAAPATSYVWNTTETTNQISVTPNVTSTFTVTATGDNACSASEEVVVTVNATPNVMIGSDTTLCKGASMTITATNGTTYLWNTGASSATINVTPLVSKTYSVTVTNALNCSASDAITITVNELPIAVTDADVTMCKESTAMIGAYGGNTLLWSNNETNTNISVSPLTTTTYTVTVTNNDGCSDSEDIVVTVVSLPTANAGSDNVICENGAATIHGSGNGINPLSYMWSPGSGLSNNMIATPTANPINTTTYVLTVTDANGCKGTDEMVLTVDARPTVNILKDTTICRGSSVTLTAESNGVSLLWNNSSTSSTISVSPTNNMVYSVTVSGANGCTNNDMVTVLVNNSPIANLGSDKSICSGASVSLSSALAGQEYSWSSLQTTQSISVSPTTTTTYTVTITNNDDCSASDAIIVVVNALPVADAGGPYSICLGNSVTMTASGGDIYNWSNNKTTVNNNVSPISNTTYTLTATSFAGCSASDATTVIVNSIPTATIDADNSTVCDNASTQVTLIADGGETYSWSTSANTKVIYDTPTVTTTYTVTAISSSGCTSSASKTITVETCTDIVEFMNNTYAVSVYPNPSKGSFTIETTGLTNNAFIQVFGIDSKLLIQKSINNSLHVNMNQYPKGMYFIRITDDHHVHTEKLIIE